MRERKRTVHMTTVHHPYDPRIYYKECLSLKKAGFEVILVAQGDTEGKIVPGIEHIRLRKHPNRWKRMIFGTYEAYRKAKKLKADVYHFHDPELMIVGWLLKKKDNVVIYDIHEEYTTSILQKGYLPRWVRTVLAKTYQWIERLFTRKMALCLAEKYYKDLYDRGKCILNYPTIQTELLEANRQSQTAKDKLLYTGNVTKDRGALFHAQLPLIDPSIIVSFVGKCDRKLADEMRATAKDGQDRLHFEGIDQFVKKERIEEIYLQDGWLAGLALFPETDHYQKKELTKFFEYMLAGLPIICANFPAWQEFIDHYQCGIAVDPLDPAAIKAALQFLRTHPTEAQKMGARGRQAVLQELNWDQEAKKLIRWYDQLLDLQEHRKKGRVES